ncbi:hypothetical protein CC78DRAFT_574241 [Lojkania enalia]|uniref:PH domain-containing protein n=1 Tax=Lojkania enalia TaxID=147567 RepID=A0A9P4NBD7_9PLEO|nr:hypothetical protein CC78DRAFT_574241 [Didymosphaeria enalia]
MATTANPLPGAYSLEDHNGSDPFISSSHDAQRQRYSAFDNSQFSLYLNGSPAQAKRALQAHLSETTRRLQEASHLGNALVQQRKELEEKLKEVEKQEEDSDIGPELRNRLAELEKEFNEVGRETARVFVPKSRVPSGETDTTAGASVYSSEAHHSPSKVSVPSRKQRNQQPSRINDIALATEISTSLLSQLKELQAVLLEKDEALKAANLDRSQLQIEIEGLSQRLRTIDESESRLKDVNWNLETQVRDFEGLTKAATDKEHRLNQNLNLIKSEKAQLEREFEELKQMYAKLNDDNTSKAKQHETELSGLRRNVSMGETERGALQRKVDELASQNQELAKAVAYRMRSEDQMTGDETSPSDGAEEGDTITPEHSPPPSPSKATPRHGQLESETLKHSLHHAHRMIQQLKNNIHREKTEKIELKRMLQDARDELETNRSSIHGPGSAGKRRKNDKDVFKKPARPDRLGALRTGSQEIVVDDDEWEEHDGPQNTPSRRPRQIDSVPGAFPSGFSSAAETTEGFETANETSDAFETANERDGTATETDAFQTGAETLDGDSSDDLTETEGGGSSTARAARPSPLSIAGNRNSFQSTASTSGDDDDDDMDVKTPIQSQHPRYRLKLRQAGYRRSTARSNQDIFTNTPPIAKDSPASVNSNNSTPVQGKSLFAELGNMSGESEDGSVADGTPSRSSMLSPDSSPELMRRSVIGRSPLQSVSVPKPVMVDSSMMTEPAKLEQMGVSSISTQETQAEDPIVEGTPLPSLHLSPLLTQDTVPQSPIAVKQPLYTSAISAQGTEPISPVIEKIVPPPLSVSSIVHQTSEPKTVIPPLLRISSIAHQTSEPRTAISPSLGISSIAHQASEPKTEVRPPLDFSSITHQTSEPEIAVSPSLTISSLAQQSFEPREASVPREPARSPLLVSSIATQATEPLEPAKSTPHVMEKPQQTPLYISSLSTQASEPLEPSKPMPTIEERKPGPLYLSSHSTQATQPVEAHKPTPSHIFMLPSQCTEPIEPSKPEPPRISSFSSQFTDPIAAQKPVLPQISSFLSQSTKPLAPRQPPPPQISSFSSQSTKPIEPLKRSLSQASVITVQHTEPIRPVLISPNNRFSDVLVLQDTQPESPTLPAFLPNPSRPSTAHRVPAAFSLSEILFQETEPQEPSRPVTAHRTVPPSMPVVATSSQTAGSRDEATDSSKLGFFSSVLPWSKTGDANASPVNSRDGRPPLAPIASNAVQKDRSSSPPKSLQRSTTDEGTQTMVSADQIEKLLLARIQRHSGTISAAGIEKRMSPPASPKRSSIDHQRTPRRPGSSGSIRSRTASPPPLPADHKEVIAAATLKSPPQPTFPTTPGTMGPPAMPASAYKKRPQTPTIKTNTVSSPKTGGTTPRARYQQPRSDTARSGASSPITRQSSVSSFASEIDMRFNIGATPFAQSGLDPNTTDPRMIQAITQTMIGEFLWKYTRKAGREGMSENRHRRFFWVHPYTRTLYWSEQDPTTAGRAQLKAKSVAIEAVQVVTDDNPYPPGLHRKSLVVITPGRTIKFTAPTGQRHETWFNALSYLLMRTSEEVEGQKETNNEIQNEFNPSFRSSSRQTGRSRASYSSHISRRTSSPHHVQIPTLRHTSSQQQTTSADPRHGSMSGRLSSLSGVLRPSFSSRKSRASAQDATTYEQPNYQHSAEDFTRELMEKSERDMSHLEMENVRACCDGKHDVGHLHHSQKGRHSTRSRASLAGSMSSRSHSRAESHKHSSHIHHQNELEAANSGAGY